MVDGNEEEAFEWVMHINRWSRSEAEKAADFAFRQWERRSRHQWRVDYSWVTRTHGFQPDEEGLRRAAIANQELVSMAAARAGSLNVMEEVPPSSGQLNLPEPAASQRPDVAPVPQRQSGKIMRFFKSLFRE